MKNLITWLRMQYGKWQLRRMMRRIIIDNRSDEPGPMLHPDQIEDESWN